MPGLPVPLSTLRGRPRMTRGRCGSLALHRTTLSFATPRRFSPAHGRHVDRIRAPVRVGSVAAGRGPEARVRTLIRGGWVIGFANGGHALYRDGSVVFEADRIVHVGHGFDGRVDREIDARGKLVSPGF